MIRALPQMLSSRGTAMQMTLAACAEFSGIHFHKDTLCRSDEQSFAPQKRGGVKWKSCCYPPAMTSAARAQNVSTPLSSRNRTRSGDKLLATRQSECVIGRGSEVMWNGEKQGLNLAQVNLRLSSLLIGFK